MSQQHAPSSASSLSSGPTLIGMIRARKLATKIKKRAQFLVAERRRMDNTGKAVTVHRDFPKNTRVDDHLGIGKSFHNLRIQTPTQSRSPSVGSKQGYSTAINTIQEVKNTYRTEPVNRFSRKEVTDVIEEVLSEHLEGQTYNYEFCKDTSKKLSEVIKQRVKYMGYSRYKLICVVYMGQVKNQGMRIASRCLWNTEFDNVAEASYRNGELFAVATVFGAFYE
ncbi:tctex1 domain-containing protein 1-B-like [Actinia tenebrosa]|uniref:Tctex1 domain-containing protein 1-B-like n=1 Tax=Actinia tenebrosa TaxID=6105 RepID=A0A6P8ICR3_ACTTE|nr:tctex1 domain-containing protein 1-B-like [Actinia tenebrosa]